ncbi:hypothetical protein CDIK_0682 [Cucumispora dikerogammari]|nr:hypothetical protein CDIK_0682 [Cucumispora dikerogammari]
MFGCKINELSVVLMVIINIKQFQEHRSFVNCCQENSPISSFKNLVLKGNESLHSEKAQEKYISTPVDTANTTSIIAAQQNTSISNIATMSNVLTNAAAQRSLGATCNGVNNYPTENLLDVNFKESKSFLDYKTNNNLSKVYNICGESQCEEHETAHKKSETETHEKKISDIRRNMQTPHDEIIETKIKATQARENLFVQKSFIEKHKKDRKEKTENINSQKEPECRISYNKSYIIHVIHRTKKEPCEKLAIEKTKNTTFCTSHIDNDIKINKHYYSLTNYSKTLSSVGKSSIKNQQSDAVMEAASIGLDTEIKQKFNPLSITSDPFIFDVFGRKTFYVDYGLQDHGKSHSLEDKLLGSNERGFFKLRAVMFDKKDTLRNQHLYKEFCIYNIPVFLIPIVSNLSKCCEIKTVASTLTILSFYKHIQMRVIFPVDFNIKMIEVLPILVFTLDPLFFSTYYINKIKYWEYKVEKSPAPTIPENEANEPDALNVKSAEIYLILSSCFENKRSNISAILEKLDTNKIFDIINKEPPLDNVIEILKKLAALKNHLNEMEELDFSVSVLKKGIIKISTFSKYFLSNGEELISRKGENFIEINLIRAYREVYRKLRIFVNSITETYNRYLRKPSEDELPFTSDEFSF